MLVYTVLTMELIKAKLMDFIVCWAAGGYMILLYSSEILYNMKFDVFAVLRVSLIAFRLVNWGTDVSVRV